MHLVNVMHPLNSVCNVIVRLSVGLKNISLSYQCPIIELGVCNYCMQSELDTSRGWPANLISFSSCSSYLYA